MRRFNLMIRNLFPIWRLLILAFLSWSQAVAADVIFAGQPMGPSSNIYAIDANGQINRLTDDTRWRDLMAHPSPDGSLVFTSNRKDNPKIDLHQHSVNFNIFTLEDGNLNKLTNDAGVEFNPQFSPDGNRIAFITYGTKSNTLQVMDRTGRKRRSLVNAQKISDFSWSPDGTEIAYAMQDGDRSAVEVVKLKHNQPSPPRSLVEYRASVPDENLPPATAQKINGLSQVVTSAQWSPDGHKIAYIVSSLKEQERVLRVLDLKSGEDRQISSENIHVQQPVTWASDSERLLFAALVNYEFYYDEKRHEKVYEGGMHIFVATTEGQHRQLTQGDHLHNRPVFSPNGKSVAYLYGEKLDSRTLSIRVMNLDGKPEREIFYGVTRDSFLYWTPITNTKTLAGVGNG